MAHTSHEVLTAFKNLCSSRGYTRKYVGDWRYEEDKGSKIGKSCKLWGSPNHGDYMEIYDEKVGHRERILVDNWLNYNG